MSTQLGSPHVTIDPALASALLPELHFTPDFQELGEWLGRQNSDKQAEFFIGFYLSASDTQLAYIGPEIVFDADGDRKDIAQFYRDLAEHIAEGTS